jgi:proline iminopeptidase
LNSVAEERPVVFYDQLGSGYSDRIVDLERYAIVSRFVSEVASIRKELGLEKVHLIGHSWGAAVALEHLLTEDATGVESVIFMGPYFGTERWIEDAEYLLAQLPEEVQAAVREAEASGDFSTDAFKAANKAFAAEYGRRYPPETPNPDCTVKPPGNSGLYNYMWGPSEFLSTGTLKDYDRIDQLSKLDLPVLFLAGEYDEARPETMREFQAMVRGSKVKVIPNAGHTIGNDQPLALNQAINEFLASVEK